MNRLAFFVIAILIFTSRESLSQCIADAGRDTTTCIIMSYDTLTLGGSPTATGGSGNYTYSWSTYIELSPTLKFYASDFLDDTTVANPRLIAPYRQNDGLKFNLSVIDSSGNTCVDSVRFYFCSIVVLLWDRMEFICPGDTVRVGTNGNTFCHPLSYEWFPKYNISDPYSPNPMVWPDTTTYYYAKVTDSLGCEWEDEINEIFVCPSALDNSEVNLKAKVYPNPFDDEIIIEMGTEKEILESVTLLSESGQTILHFSPRSSATILNTRNLPLGMYILVLESESQIQRSKVFKK